MSKERQVPVSIGGETVYFHVEGKTIVGDRVCLLAQDDNLIEKMPWAAEGFSVERFLGATDHNLFLEGIRRLIFEKLREKDLIAASQFPQFSLEKYHHFVTTDEAHFKLVLDSREGFRFDQFPMAITTIEERISEILGFPVVATNPHHGKQTFYIRIIRPQSRDNNPPHRDVWLDDLRHAVNIYVPIAGSNALSSLPLVPGSHLWLESEIERTATGAKVNSLEYRVPAVVGPESLLHMVRPNPLPNELMIFSPYLVHGGGVNQNHDLTRMSLEMRFWRASNSEMFC